MRLSDLLKPGAAAARKWFKAGLPFRARETPLSDDQHWDLTASETAAFHRFRSQECAAADLLDERTWSDLEMEKVYLRFNRCVTPLGAQYLYTTLRTYQTAPAALEANVGAYETFKSHPDVAATLRRALSKLNRRESADLADFLHGPPPEIPAGYRFFYLTSALAIACPIGLFFSPWFIPATVIFWMLNIYLYYVHGMKLVRHSPALLTLGTLLGSVPKITEAIQTTSLPELAELQSNADAARSMHKQISLAFLRRDGGDELTRLVIEYLNLLCLFEVSALCRAIRAVNHERRMLLDLFQIAARLDALQAISRTLAEYPSVCVPEIKSGRRFLLTDVQHPLVNNPVLNSIEGAGHSLLLTGTNMAGKTTFIKTLAVNLLLAQTIGVCLATRAVLPPARVRTLIAREDIIASGQSYFYFEAAELLRMLQDAETSGREYWFVLDEIFRGTNTLERVAAGTAVLSHLTHCGLVLASTHDHELTHLLRDEFDLYHFSEVITGKEARFDYQLRPGPCTTRNAIKLLSIAGFPKHVIDQAEKLASSNNGDVGTSKLS